MIRIKAINALIPAVLLAAVIAGGCARQQVEAPLPAKAAADMTLKFRPQQVTRYRLTTESHQSVDWQGPLPDQPVFQGGRNISTVEMTFTQQVRSVGEDGFASAKITIDGLKYSSVIKDEPILEFDSTAVEDADSPCAKLIGQSYTITISPSGNISNIDAAAALRTVEGTSNAHKIAARLVEDHTIKARHGTAVLPAPSQATLATGQVYKNTRDFAFGLMGSKAYERVYRVDKIDTRDDRLIATITMETVPVAPAAGQVREAESSELSKKFDSKEDYSGEMVFDATAGEVERYKERLELQWTLVEPPTGENTEPLVLNMGASRVYELEKID
jgi:hypothetical protein